MAQFRGIPAHRVDLRLATLVRRTSPITSALTGDREGRTYHRWPRNRFISRRPKPPQSLEFCEFDPATTVSSANAQLSLWKFKTLGYALFMRTRVLTALAVSAALATSLVSFAAPSGATTKTVPKIHGLSISFAEEPLGTPAQVLATANQIFPYAHSLGANSVALNFPFYLAGQSATNPASHANSVVAGPGTPSPTLLGQIVAIANANHLAVQLRPLLSEEGDKPPLWRGSVSPASKTAWFNSYVAFLKPYFAMAKTTYVASFAVGSELSSLVKFTTGWKTVMTLATKTFGGQLYYVGINGSLSNVTGAKFGYDNYFSISPPLYTTVTATNATGIFASGMTANLKAQHFPAATSVIPLEEIWISAAANKWLTPWSPSPWGTPVERWVQTSYFTAACQVAKARGFAGIYYFGLNFNDFTPTYNADSSKNSNTWQGTASATAISNCFKTFN